MLIVSGVLLFSTMQLPSFGQGLGFDESRQILVDGVRIYVTLDMKPVFLEEDDRVGTAFISIREVNTDTTIPHITLRVKMMRTNELLLDDQFHSSDGIVAIRFEHTDTEKNEVIGNRESLYNAVVTNREIPAVVKGPVLDGGLYHYNISVLSLGQYENKLAEPLNFDLYASIGKTTRHQVLDDIGKQHDIFIKTYYDQISNIYYDESLRMITFSMPLYWNVNYLSQVPLVHEEVHIPHDLTELMSNSYVGTINGVELSNREILIDDYSYENTRIVHFVISKDKLIRIAQKEKSEQNTAVFSLIPREVPKFPVQIMSGKENFLLQISWSPALIEPDTNTKFIITLRDPKTFDTLRHSTADFVLLKDGTEIFRKHHKAPIGAIVQDYTFTKEQTGTILLLIENINNTGEAAPLLFTVIPEFPFGPLFTMITLVSAVVIIRIRPSLTKLSND
tara:strand:+ start:1457 stop:2803 length:1347 start_codon:yes stop_codon:yes gene_type:complete